MKLSKALVLVALLALTGCQSAGDESASPTPAQVESEVPRKNQRLRRKLKRKTPQSQNPQARRSASKQLKPALKIPLIPRPLPLVPVSLSAPTQLLPLVFRTASPWRALSRSSLVATVH